MTPILTRLARDIDLALGGSVCRDAIRDASNGGADLSLVHWRFLAEVLRAMPPATDEVQATIDPVIDMFDRLGRGEEWTRADASPAQVAAAAARWATSADVTRAHQRDILLRLIEEASA